MKNFLLSVVKKSFLPLVLLFPVIIVGIFSIVCKQVFIAEFFCSFLFIVTMAQFVHIRANLRQVAVLSFSFSLSFPIFICLNKLSSSVLYAFCIIFLLFGLIRLVLSVYICSAPKIGFKDSSQIYSDKTVLIFVPHEDDDINLCGSIIKRYTENNSKVRVAFFTNGDYYNSGSQRLREALIVMKKLGVKETDVFFLGYSDSLITSDNCHICNFNDDVIVASKAGRTKTYALKNHKPYHDSDFTKNNMLFDIQSVITDVRADVIFCCDYDWHHDHRALSLLFEQAMNNILIRDRTYRPKVYKGFAYSTSWESEDDFYDTLNTKSSKNCPSGDIMLENNMYLWKNRVRFPVHASDISNVLQSTLTFKLLAAYSSQNAINFASRVVNSDKVFFERNTNSLLYDSVVTASSGENFDITGFSLCASSDIMDTQVLPSLNCWIADSDDSERTIKIKLSKKSDIKYFVIYDSPVKENHIKNAFVKIGSDEFYTGELNEYGETRFNVNVRCADEIMIKVIDFQGACSISKIEAFATDYDEDTQIIKLVDTDDNFCGNYIFENGDKESFSVYSYPDSNVSYTITSYGNIEFMQENGIITVVCKKGCHGNLKIVSDDNKAVFDEITISNPDKKQHKKIKFKQQFDKKFWTILKLKSYYSGLFKRIFMH